MSRVVRIDLNPNRARITRPAERYRWSSYRNYVGGPAAASWVETGVVLNECGGSPERYREYVEAGKGEGLVSPFERAVAGLVLGTEAFAKRIGKTMKGREDRGDQAALSALRREFLADPVALEELVETLFSD